MASPKELVKDVNFILRCIIAIFCLVIVILWGACDFAPGMSDFSSYVLFAHAAPAYTVVMVGIIIGYFLGNIPAKKLMLIYASSGACLFIVTAILQLMNMGDFSGNDVLIMAILHLVVGILFVTDDVLNILKSKGSAAAEE